MFAALIALSFITAFVLPARFTVPGAGWLQGLFAPVSRPVGAIARLALGRFHPDSVTDPASTDKPRLQQSVYEENQQLRSAYASLLTKFDALSKLNADRQAVGDIRSLCKPATVTGTEGSGLAEGLNVTIGGSSSGLMDHPVIRGNPSQSPLPCELVGKVVRCGPAGAMVRLVTDPGSTLSARIGRYVPQPDGRLKLVYLDQIHRPLISGMGHNQMAVASNLSLRDVQAAGVAVNDVVLLDDDQWPGNIQGFEVGHIVSIGHQARHPLLADIRIEPQTNLLRLTEVMVMIH